MLSVADVWAWPLLLFVAPIVALFVGCAVLYQFAAVYKVLVGLAGRTASNALWNAMRPYFRDIVKCLKEMLGDPDRLLAKMQPTHVILCAILIVLIVSAERVVALLATRNARR